MPAMISVMKFVIVSLAVLLLGTACVPPSHMAAQGARQNAPGISAADTQISSSPLSFNSTLEVTEFAAENQQLIAIGFFTVIDFEGNSETVPVTLPVIDMVADAPCSTLTVTLGPVDLQVLGLSINADTVQLVTVANPDKGFNGLMLCGIVEAFKNADMNLVAAMLNEVLDLFG
jgi:hypothetical protein